MGRRGDYIFCLDFEVAASGGGKCSDTQREILLYCLRLWSETGRRSADRGFYVLDIRRFQIKWPIGIAEAILKATNAKSAPLTAAQRESWL
jgi:hypothetical protein